jgi:alpha-beta hydrolase superfamily lysophospholipase
LVRHDEGRAATKDGLGLYWQRWLPETPRAVLLLIHGLGEHSGRYAHVASWFAERGDACWAIDYRGHGRSDGVRVDVERFDEFVDDVALLRGLARERFPGLPHFLVGHSQGGLVALRSLLAEPEGLAGAIVSAPLLGIHPSAEPSAPLLWASRLLLRVAPSLRLTNTVNAAWLSRDPGVAAAYVGDPLVSHKVSVRWYWSLLEAIADTQARASSLRLPVLVMCSGDDRLTDADAAERWARAAPAALIEFVRWSGYYHEMFNEPQREPVFQRMHRWLCTRPGPAAPAP